MAGRNDEDGKDSVKENMFLFVKVFSFKIFSKSVNMLQRYKTYSYHPLSKFIL